MSAEITLPFELDVLLPRDAREYEIDIELSGETEEEDALKASDEMVRLFALAVNEQMLSKGRGEPIIARMELSESFVEDAGQRWRYLYRAQSVPPSSYFVLLALLAQTRFAEAPLQHVSIRARGERAGFLDTRELMLLDRNVPERIAELPFTVDEGERVESNFVAITMRFRERVSLELFEVIAEAFNIWDHHVILGGFEFDFREQEDFSPEFGRTAHLSPNVVEHALENFSGAESACNAIVNFGARLHAEGHQLQSITIE
jgi:hypothetical protein